MYLQHITTYFSKMSPIYCFIFSIIFPFLCAELLWICVSTSHAFQSTFYPLDFKLILSAKGIAATHINVIGQPSITWQISAALCIRLLSV